LPTTARFAARLAALLAGALLLPWRPAPDGLELWALDVGSGTGVALRAAGAGTWVFDAGSRDRSGVARAALAPLLAAWECGPVSIVLSHEDRDHHAALGWLAERYPVRLWAGALPAHLSERLAHTVPALDAGPGRFRLPVPGREEDVRLELWRAAEGSGNEASRTLVLDWHGRRVILSGDAEGAGLAALVRSGALEGPARLLLLPHHGSETAALGELLARSRPEEVWISASRPPPVARELDRRGLAWRWTGRDGPLGLRLAARGSATGTERADSTP
jgi:competence protein ComEC